MNRISNQNIIIYTVVTFVTVYVVLEARKNYQLKRMKKKTLENSNIKNKEEL